MLITQWAPVLQPFNTYQKERGWWCPTRIQIHPTKRPVPSRRCPTTRRRIVPRRWPTKRQRTPPRRWPLRLVPSLVLLLSHRATYSLGSTLFYPRLIFALTTDEGLMCQRQRIKKYILLLSFSCSQMELGDGEGDFETQLTTSETSMVKYWSYFWNICQKIKFEKFRLHLLTALEEWSVQPSLDFSLFSQKRSVFLKIIIVVSSTNVIIVFIFVYKRSPPPPPSSCSALNLIMSPCLSCEQGWHFVCFRRTWH